MKRLLFRHLLRPSSCPSSVSASPGLSVMVKKKTIPFRHFDLIKDFTGQSPACVKKALSNYLELQMLDEKTLQSKIKLIQGMKLKDQHTMRVIPFLIKHPSRLKNRYHCFHEYGVDPQLISTSLLRRFIALNKLPIHFLIQKGLIPKDTDVMLNLWKAAELPLESCPKINDVATLYDLKTIALKAYFMNKLEITENIWERKKNLFLFRFRNKSFYTMNRNYRIFRDIVKLSPRRMRKNWFVLYTDPDNTMYMLNDIKKVGQVDVKDCLHFHPKISTMTPENLEKNIQYITEAGIPVDCIIRTLKILTLNCETVRTRLEELKNNDFFIFNKRHPKILELVHYFVKAKKRLEILNQLQMIADLKAISMTEKHFERLCLRGGRATGLDCVYYLASELDMEKHELLDKLKRHPRWKYAPVIQIGRNLQELRKDFSDSEIRNNIYALFYYSEKLKAEVEKINSREELSYFKENEIVKREFVLPLVLYFLERETNFTGESVWDLEVNPYQDVPDPTELLKSNL